MAIVLVQERDTQTISSQSVPYFLYDTSVFSRGDAIIAALAQGVTDQGVAASDFRFTRLSPTSARVELVYQPWRPSRLNRPDVGELESGFNFSMGPIRRVFPLERIASYPEDAPPIAGINVPTGATFEYARGVDLPPPPEKFWCRFPVANASINDAYVAAIAGLVGTCNDGTFKSYTSGTLCLVRASGERRDNDSWSLYMGFGYEPAVSGLVVGTHTISHDGFDYAWPYNTMQLFEGPGGEEFMSLNPKFIYVDRIIPRGNFSLLGVP